MAWNLTQSASSARENASNSETFGVRGSEPRALSVSEALACARDALQGVQVTIEGEVSQFRDNTAYKGVYFSMADETGALDCFIWRNRYLSTGVQLRTGLRVRVSGRFSVYPAKGRMQFEVATISLAGEGELRARVAALARRLEAEGLMDPARKLPIPSFCQRVAIITSPQGKVKDDVARTLRRRNPMVELQFCAVTVEGPTAASQMVEALRVAQEAAPDAILLVRGGGSYEDLMPFNDEGLARAVAFSRVPVITGIGHEPDTTICDMVCARRSSTPTAAAESVAPSAAELLDALAVSAGRMSSLMGARLNVLKRDVAAYASRPVLAQPTRSLFENRREQLDMASDRLMAAIPNGIARSKTELEGRANRLKLAGPRILDSEKTRLDARVASVRSVGTTMLDRFSRVVAVGAARLDSLSPLAVLGRGYAMATGEDGHVVKSVRQVKPEDALTVRVWDGNIHCVVERVTDGLGGE